MRLGVILCAICYLLYSCKVEMIYDSHKYHEGQNVFEFYPDNTYSYYVKSPRYVSRYNYGSWRQIDNHLILSSKVLNDTELPIVINSFPSNYTGQEIFINTYPKKETNWDTELGIIDILNIDLVSNGNIYPIKNDRCLVKLEDLSHDLYFRAYPKGKELNMCDVLADTLYSKVVDLKTFKERNLNVNIDLYCNPFYFAQVKIPNDTMIMRVINNKLYWPSKRLYLEMYK